MVTTPSVSRSVRVIIRLFVHVYRHGVRKTATTTTSSRTSSSSKCAAALRHAGFALSRGSKVRKPRRPSLCLLPRLRHGVRPREARRLRREHQERSAASATSTATTTTAASSAMSASSWLGALVRVALVKTPRLPTRRIAGVSIWSVSDQIPRQSRLALAAARSPPRWHGLRRVPPGRHVLPRFHCCGVQRV